MKSLLAIVLFTTVIILSGCENDIIPADKDFLIEFGSQCGWCAGEEMITINSIKIEYTRTIPCGENQGITNKNKLINEETLDSIWSSFDYDSFKSLEYNECNFCADGCDEIIRITKNKKTHELRYSPEKEVVDIEKLRQILAEILAEMRDQF